MEKPLKLEFLDHVAIRVKDLEFSANWYEQVLGLNKRKLKKWGDFPIFMLSNQCGVALFPATLEDEPLDQESKNIKIDHFAFNVNQENFDLAQKKFSDLGLKFIFKDHYYFHSIYIKDPDGHTVELTTIQVDGEEFYEEM